MGENELMKIIILDGYTENPGDLSWDAIRALGDLTIYDRTNLTDEKEIQDRIGDAEIVITNKTPISQATMTACKNIRFIALLATGYNVVDITCAKERNIVVSNVPVYGTRSVSQFAIALLLEVCHHIGHHDATVHAGKWETCVDWCYWDYPLIELADKTYGLLGCGNIGIHTAAIARALGMRVIAYDSKHTEAAQQLGVAYVTLDELFAQSDVLGLQMPLFPFNTGIINKESIAKMKDGVIIINNSRGQMIVEQDLADALNSGKVAAAGLDVVSTEPIHSDNPLLHAKNCIITPHMSWGAKESRQRILDCTVGNLRAFLADKPVNVVSGNR
jgi:glycerate dehydrogenase